MKHYQTLRRGLSILLSLVLCLSLLPATARAEETSAETADFTAADTTAATALKLPADAKIVLADGTTNTITTTK